jgi:5-methylcytosine-specific restriction endonuclease McrA
VKTATTKRKGISKKTRFEVFKRDEFTCCYCGNKPPTVVLEVDHIVPVVEGGTDDVDNLASACFDCNRGKSSVPLSHLPESMADQRALLIEREEQERAYIRFVKSKRRREKAVLVELAETLWGSGYRFVPRAETSIRVFLAKIPYDQLLLAAEKAAAKFPDLRGDEAGRKFKYFCGICWRVINGDDRGGRYKGRGG